MPTLFGRKFLAIVGAVVDMRQSRISFAAIDENVFYKAIPPKVYIQLLTFAAASQKGSSDMSDVKKVSLVPMLNDTTLVLVDISRIGILLHNQTSLEKRGRGRGRREKKDQGWSLVDTGSSDLLKWYDRVQSAHQRFPTRCRSTTLLS